MRTKICGITTRDDLELAVEAGADAIGLLVDVPVETPREIDCVTARSLVDATPPFVSTVLVTMADTVGNARTLIKRVGADAIQIHGLESTAVRELHEKAEADVLAAVAPSRAIEYDGCCDGLLVDSLDDAGAGGTGTTHDWDQTRACVAETTTPVIVAGGLTPENVADAIEQTQPYGVDVASGVEQTGGRKSSNAVTAFIRAARSVGVRA
ncbi:phosphoribosylanthranilate isomerase [Halocatena halophila]|uniref:phosphoribosylanthranilate isomerase n=1 Tax=Halocatena halophila TaxID=2814576 RepID=UPI002ED40BC2